MRSKIYLETTKYGYPALWEEGGGYANAGSATIISGPNGERLFPAYIRWDGRLSCDKHALFIVHEGYMVIDAVHHRQDFQINVYRITAIHNNEDGSRIVADIDRINCFANGEWESNLQPELEEPVQAAIHKATEYHCRGPRYIAANNYWGYDA